MLKIIDDKIYLVRGDDAILKVELAQQDGTAYEMQEGDIIALTVRKLPNAESEVLLSVTGASGSNEITIPHAATEGLEYGEYSADIQLTYSDGRRDTVWPEDIESSTRIKGKNMGNFILVSEVTI